MKFCNEYLDGDITQAVAKLRKQWPDLEVECNEGLLVNLFLKPGYYLELLTDEREKAWFCRLNTIYSFNLDCFWKVLAIGKKAVERYDGEVKASRTISGFKLIWQTDHFGEITHGDKMTLELLKGIYCLSWQNLLAVEQVDEAFSLLVLLARRLNEPGVLRLPPPIPND